MSSKDIARRDFLKYSATAVTAATSTGSFAYAAQLTPAQASPPNIVFIICDQMRGDALSCLGSRNARTPALDKLAAAGVLFRNHFSNNPVCSPSRVSLFTGLYPHQHGQLTNKSGKSIEDINGTLLGYFREKGYRLGWVGKNHTCSKNVLRTLDTWENRDREPFRQYNKFVPPYWHCDTLWPEEECYPRMNTDGAIHFIEDAKPNEPFFLHVSYFDPHPPYMAPSEFSSKYCSQDFKLPPFVHPIKLSPRLEEQYRALNYDKIKDTDLLETMRYYYAAIEWGVDLQVSRIVDALSRKGILENTILIFTSDHGDFMGHHRMVRKGMFLYDVLLHVPLIFYAPGRIGSGIKLDQLAQHVDVFPTLVDLTFGEKREDLPGQSLKPLLRGEAAEDKERRVYASAAYSDLEPDYFDHPEPAYNPDSDVPFHTRVEHLTWREDKNTMMVRTQKWKCILSESRPPELYKMSGTCVEKDNVADEKAYAPIRKSLEQDLLATWKW